MNNQYHNSYLYPSYLYMPVSVQAHSPGQPVQTSAPQTQPANEEGPYQLNPNWTARYPNDIFSRGPSNCKSVALTFDDAPDSLFGPVLLDIMASYSVKATFFCQGTCVHSNPDIVQRLVKEGHIVANHSYNHLDLTALTPDKIREEVATAEAEIQRVTGLKTALFRPPYGALNDTVIEVVLSMEYKIIMWDVDSLDWMGLTGPQIAARVIPNIVPGSVILMHNACGGSVAAGTGTAQSLPFIIEVLKAEGYGFSTIPALLNIPAYR